MPGLPCTALMYLYSCPLQSFLDQCLLHALTPHSTKFDGENV